MKKLKLTANWGLKIASLLFAALLWFLVTNINDPVDSVRFSNIPVTLRNTSSVTDDNKVYEVLEGTDTISTVTVYAPRSIVDSLNRDNIVAVADFDETVESDGEYSVAIQLSTNKYSNQVQSISATNDTVRLNIEERASKTLAISATTTGALTEGYIIGDVVTDQNQIRITGAKSVVESVVSASVNVEVTGYTTNIGTNAEIHLYNAEGEEIPKDNIKLSSSAVGVSVTILGTKRVPVNYVIAGIPADGYMSTGVVEAEPESVLLAGRASALNSIDEISVADSSLDVTGLKEDLTVTIDLSGYLPNNVSFGDEDFNGIATVVAHIEPTSEATFNVPYEQITLENIPEGYEAEIESADDDRFEITLKGLKTTISSVKATDVSGIVDVASLIEDASETDDLSGVYDAQVTLSLPGGVTTNSEAQVKIVLKAIED